MTHSLPIRTAFVKTPDGEIVGGHRHSWWDNFTRATREEKYGPGLNFAQYDWLLHRYNTLAEYNATYDGTYVHFETEQDAILFLLRWS